jgi:hypothetical protein
MLLLLAPWPGTGHPGAMTKRTADRPGNDRHRPIAKDDC